MSVQNAMICRLLSVIFATVSVVPLYCVWMFSLLNILNLFCLPEAMTPASAEKDVALAMFASWMMKRLVARTLNRLVNCRLRNGVAAVKALAPGLMNTCSDDMVAALVWVSSTKAMNMPVALSAELCDACFAQLITPST